MPTNQERALEQQLQFWQQQKQGAEYTKRSYIDRKKSMVAKIAELQGLLEGLEHRFTTADADIAEAERHIAETERELHEARFGDRIARAAELRAELEQIEAALRGTPLAPKQGT